MKLTYENIFLSAEATFEGKNMFVYKINAKSFYAGTMPFEIFMDKYEKKPKSIVFKDFCTHNTAKQYTYEGFDISEEEVEKGKKIGIKKKDKDEKRYLSLKAEKLLRDVYTDKYKKGKSYQHPLYDDKTEFHVVEAHPDNKILLNIDNNYILFNMISKKYLFLEDVFKKELNSKNIPWDLSL